MSCKRQRLPFAETVEERCPQPDSGGVAEDVDRKCDRLTRQSGDGVGIGRSFSGRKIVGEIELPGAGEVDAARAVTRCARESPGRRRIEQA